MTDAIRRLGRYELLEQLGEGGMGTVWLARLTGAHGFEKLCIVKTVLPAIAKDKDFVSRFLHEGRVLTQLSHANIAQVFDMGEEGESLYLALEYVPGVDLARLHEALRARNEVLPLPVAVFIMQQAAEGLGYAHRKAAPDGAPLNIVHRDVSPQNIMVSYDGEVKVIDFGIAKSEARSKATAQASVMGKLGYMAPEQALGANVDHRADQYAAAVVLWELLANRSFIPRGTMTEMVVAMAHPQLRPLAPLRPDVPLALEQVVLRALAPAVDQRFPTTDDFSKALHDELVKAGQLPTKKAVGEYVRQHCSDAWSLQQQLLSRLSTLRTKMPLAASALDTAKATPGFEQTYVRPTGDFGPAAAVTNPASPGGQARTALAQGSANLTQPQAGNQLPTQPNLRPVSLEDADGTARAAGAPGHTQQQFAGLPPLAAPPGTGPQPAPGQPAAPLPGAGAWAASPGPGAPPPGAGGPPPQGAAPPAGGGPPPGHQSLPQPTTGELARAVAPSRAPLFIVLAVLAVGALVVGGLGVKKLLEQRSVGVSAEADAGTGVAAHAKDGTQPGAGAADAPKDGTRAGAGTTDAPKDATQAGAGTAEAPKDGTQAGAGTADAPKDGTQPGAGTADAPKDGTQPGAGIAVAPDAGAPAVVAAADVPDAGAEAPPPPPVADGPLVDVARAVEVYEEGDKAFVRAGKADGLKKGQALTVVGAAAEPGRHPQVGKATVLELKADTARVELDRKARRFEGERFVALAAKPEPKPDDGAKPPPAKGSLKARLKLTRTPVWAVTLFNTSGFGWSNCTITIPGQKRYALKSLPAGFSREMPIQYFTDDPGAPALADSVQIKCAQGAVTLPATE